MIIFLDILMADSVRHAGEVLKKIEIPQKAQGRQLSVLQTKGNV